MSHYTNPAFCEESEFYSHGTNAAQSTRPKQTLAKAQRSESMRAVSRNATRTGHQQQHQHQQQQQQQQQQQRPQQQRPPQKHQQPAQFELQSMHRKNPSAIQQRELPPKPGPKPIQFKISSKVRAPPMSQPAQPVDEAPAGYALVPLDELPSASKGRYAILRSQEADMLCNSSMRLTKSQDDLDRISDSTAELSCGGEGGDSFTSLPAFVPQDDDNNKLVSAFSTDFINKSMILLDQNSMQRYAIVPTEDDEEMVDSSHEIIQMHNGRAHRYAVIPTEDDDADNDHETSFSGDYGPKTATTRNYPASMPGHAVPVDFATPPKRQPQFAVPAHKNIAHAFSPGAKAQQLYGAARPQTLLQRNDSIKKLPETPTKNPIATQKLQELLQTPRKTPTNAALLQRHGSYQTIVHKVPGHYQSQLLHQSHHMHQSQMLNQSQMTLNQSIVSQKASTFTPQKLQYDTTRKVPIDQLAIEQRTTAIISPRLQQSIYNETTSSTSTDKTWPHGSYLEVKKATATIGIVSLMLMVAGVLNSGLCLYMVTDRRRSYFLDLGIISGFATATLGVLGFRSRQCDWLPNRNYSSGYILVTVFSLLNCCGLSVLLGLNPFPGTPIHDLIAGVILALSSLILLLISLGVITSKWCVAPPPDNRVDVY